MENYPLISTWHEPIDMKSILHILATQRPPPLKFHTHHSNLFIKTASQKSSHHQPSLSNGRSHRCPPPRICFLQPSLKLRQVPGGTQKSPRLTRRFWRKMHMQLPEGLAAQGPERDRIRAHRMAGSLQHPGHQREELDGALLREHRGRAGSLPHSSRSHLSVLVVADHVASGAVHLPHFRTDRI